MCKHELEGWNGDPRGFWPTPTVKVNHRDSDTDKDDCASCKKDDDSNNSKISKSVSERSRKSPSRNRGQNPPRNK